jgi:hypothetical protein
MISWQFVEVAKTVQVDGICTRPVESIEKVKLFVCPTA